jgi:hypothetical protein
MVLNAVAAACDVAARLELPLSEQERVEIQGKWWVAHGAKPLIISHCSGPVRATHHRAGTSVLHLPYDE